MKAITFFLSFMVVNLYSQTQKTEEVKIQYTNALEVFNVFITNPDHKFVDNKEYFWYTEYSGLKSTKGGTGGLLLHGDYKLYDEDGNLIKNQTYKNGLKSGNFTTWNNEGEIIEKQEYIEGDIVYWKYDKLEDDGKVYTYEWVGKMFTLGFIRRTYLKFGGLIGEEELIDDSLFIHMIHTYYPFSHKLKSKYMTSDLARENCFGDYVEYYENGNLQVKGQCAKTDLGEFGTGKWTWYYESGAIEDSATYKLFEEKYSNGKTSLIGSLIYDSKTNEWVRHGKWRSFYENGHGKVDFNYEWGELKKDD